MPFYAQDAAVGSSTSFRTARRSTPDGGDSTRSSLVVNMVDPFIRLRPKSTRKSQDDDWYIPYNKQQQPPPSAYSGIGSSPHAPAPKTNSLMAYLHSPLSPSNAQHDFERTYRFPSTIPAKAFPQKSYPQRPLPTQVQASTSQVSLDGRLPDGMRIPTTSSVPTGLRAPKLLFSPLTREARQSQFPPLPPPPSQPSDEQDVRTRTLSAPARGRHRHTATQDSKQWTTPTVCDRLVFPRPALTPHVITPPSSPDAPVIDDRSSFLTKDESRVMDEARARLKEREDWADYVHRRGRSMSFGEQRAREGAPIIGNARMRRQEHERRQSMDRGHRQRGSLSSMFSRRGSQDTTEPPAMYPSASDESMGVSKSFGFFPRRPGITRRSTGPRAPPAPTHESGYGGLPIDFNPSRYPSHRYGGIRGHTYTRSSPDLTQVTRGPASESPPLPPGPPPRTLRIQHTLPNRQRDSGVIVIGPGTTAYRAPPPDPRRPTDLGTPHTSYQSSFRSRAPRPLDLSVTLGSAGLPSALRSAPAAGSADINKALPEIPRSGSSPTVQLAPFMSLSSEVGKAMSPELRSITGMSAQRPPIPPSMFRRRSPGKVEARTPSYATDAGADGSALSKRESKESRDSTFSPARAILLKRHEQAKTRRAFQSPAQRQLSIRSTRSNVSATERDPVDSTDDAPHAMTTLGSAPLNASGTLPPTSYRPTALDEAIGRSRAASSSDVGSSTVDRPKGSSTSVSTSPLSPQLTSPISTRPPIPSPFPSSASGSSSTPRPTTRTPAAGTSAAPSTFQSSFLHVPLPPNPPDMLRTESRATTQTKTTQYSSASEGWDRDIGSIPSGMTTPTVGILGSSDAGHVPGSFPDMQAGQGDAGVESLLETPRPDPRAEDSSPDDTPSPGIISEERDFQNLFFRTPQDVQGRFPGPPSQPVSTPHSLRETGSPSRDNLASSATGLGFDFSRSSPDSDPPSLEMPRSRQSTSPHELRRTSDASSHTNGTNGTNGTSGTQNTGETNGTGQTGGTGGTGDTTGTVGTGATDVTRQTELATPELDTEGAAAPALMDVARPISMDSAASDGMARPVEEGEATLRGRSKVLPVPLVAPLSVDPNAGDRRSIIEVPTPTSFKSNNPFRSAITTPSSSQTSLPATLAAGNRGSAFSPGTFGAPTPRNDRPGQRDYFGHRHQPSDSTVSTRSAGSVVPELVADTPKRPPRPPSPGLQTLADIRDSTFSDSPLITFARLGEADTSGSSGPFPPSPTSSASGSSRSHSPLTRDPRYSAVPSFVSDFPSPPLPASPSVRKVPSETTLPSPPTPPQVVDTEETIRDLAGALRGKGSPSSAALLARPFQEPSTTSPTGQGAAVMDEFGTLSNPASPERADGGVMSSSTSRRKDRRRGTAFGQVISGPPGAGKTTYASGMHQFLTALGRPCHVINLDPAVSEPPYPCSINITDLIDLESVMEEYGLGPNGAMLYVAEYLEENIDWLIERLDGLLWDEGSEQVAYVIIDTPGQVELWTNHDSFKHVIERLTKLDYRLVSVHLSDAHYITDASKFISVALLALRSNMQLELPHVNVLSKIDLLSTYGELPFDLRYYTECQDLEYLLDSLNSQPGIGSSSRAKMLPLNRAMVELIEQYGAVSFETLAVEDKASMLKLLRVLDQAIGYIPISAQVESGLFGDPTAQPPGGEDLLSSMPALEELGDVDDVQERWGVRKAQHDAEEMKAWGMEWEMRQRQRRQQATDPSLETEGDDVPDDPDDSDNFRGMRRAMDSSEPAATVIRRQ